MSTFSGKAVLITGAGTGIGYALCQAFASAGATVALNEIDPALCQRAAQQINGTLGVELVHPYAARIMIDAHIPGRIILMSSVTGIQAHVNLSVYGITKAGIRMMAKTIALEVGKYGITANAISPGATLTERTLQDDPNFERNWASVTPNGRVGYVEDIVAAALYLASPEARHVTGQTLVVDGGWTLQSPLPPELPDLPAYSSQLR
ncbi:MAG: SDR family oxidoreductase [Chloroflexi bacterium]|nr:MAG: SDR family oxidoreductase [Chloroflexota bacterium]